MVNDRTLPATSSEPDIARDDGFARIRHAIAAAAPIERLDDDALGAHFLYLACELEAFTALVEPCKARADREIRDRMLARSAR